MRLTRINDAVYILYTLDALLLLCVCVDVPYSAGLYAVQCDCCSLAGHKYSFHFQGFELVE